MANLYRRTDVYDLQDSEARFAAVRDHWRTILKETDAHSALDVSIGTGSLTLPLAELGVELHGSDLSPEMLEKCRAKAQRRGLDVSLTACDFRELSRAFDRKFDLVASTGNSLPHVSNDDILKTLGEMDALVADGGWLYFDLRNWDKILTERRRFYLYDPIYDGDTRINLVQVWDYNSDETMTFNLLYAFEREGKIVQRETFDLHYFPVRRQKLLERLADLGYREVQAMCHPAQYRGRVSAEDADWYCVLARK